MACGIQNNIKERQRKPKFPTEELITLKEEVVEKSDKLFSVKIASAKQKKNWAKITDHVNVVSAVKRSTLTVKRDGRMKNTK